MTEPCLLGSSSMKPLTSMWRLPRLRISPPPATARTNQQYRFLRHAARVARLQLLFVALVQSAAQHAHAEHATRCQQRVDKDDRHRHAPLMIGIRHGDA